MEALNWEKMLKVTPFLYPKTEKDFLQVDGLTEGHVVYINITDGSISAKGNCFGQQRLGTPQCFTGWRKEWWFRPVKILHPIPYLHRIKQGWALLFDGKKLISGTISRNRL